MTGPGFLVALEGIDGAGTTTQAQLLVGWMQNEGRAAHLTCEPSHGPMGALLREILAQRTRPVDRVALALLFGADRLDHVHHEIEPLLARGTHVVSDRYVYSSLAYQSLDADLEWVATINRLAPEPDLTIYLRLQPEAALARVAARGSQREIFETSPQQEGICRAYDALFGSTSDAGSWQPDPTGSGWIRPDPTGSRQPHGCDDQDPGSQARRRIPQDPTGSAARAALHARLARQPEWAVLDAALPLDLVHHQLRALLRSFVEWKTCARP